MRKDGEGKTMRPLQSHHPAGPGNDQGFTLLELLMAVTLVAVIVLITAGAMRLGSRAVSASEKRIEVLERYRASLYIVDAQIQSQVPLTTEDDGVKKNQFRGDSRRMSFTTNYSIWSGTRGYVAVTYRVESGGPGTLALYASEQTSGMENKKEAKLFDYCSDIHFDYYFKGVEDEGQWTDQWTDEYAIPEKVRLSLAFGKKKIALVIPVRARGERTTAMPGSSGTSEFKEKI